jgi:uncharacterized membrane protein
MDTMSRPRLDSVDLVRGLVMIFMAIDHVRYPYFTNIGVPADNTNLTYLSLFLTRWITHFSAPMFFFLAGTGAYLMTTRGKSIPQVSRFLWTRGLWLVILELTLIEFAWSFMPGWMFGGVIWALGWSMVILAFVIRFPLNWVALFGVIIMIFHHLLDGISASAFGTFDWMWKFLHAGGSLNPEWLPARFFPVLYTIIPGCGVMAAGFGLGAILQKPEAERRRLILYIGIAMTLLFVILRLTNWYGSPPDRDFPPQVPAEYRTTNQFAPQASFDKTIIAFLNTQKYPFSLQFLLMTIGPALIVLSWADRFTYTSKIGKWIGQKIVIFGRVPLFFYAIHLFLIHLLAIAVSAAMGLSFDWLIGKPLPFVREAPEGFGFGLTGTYLITALVVVILYFLCRWFAGVKQRRSDWWISYF